MGPDARERRDEALTTWLLVLALVCIGCSSPTDDATHTHKSGSRLRAMLLDGGGGAITLRAWFDSELGIECTFQVAGDGSVRCLPAARHAPLFADPQCSVRGFLLPTCESAPPYVSLAAASTGTVCGSGSVEVYKVGEAATADVAYALDGFGNCGQVAFTDSVLYFAGGEALPQTFVAASTTDQATPGGPVVRTLRADDGAEQVLGLFDPSTSLPCSASLRGYGGEYADRCIPNDSPSFVAAVYSDGLCTTLGSVAEIPSAGASDCHRSGLALQINESQPGACSAPTFEVRELGDVAPTAGYFRLSASGCAPFVTAPGMELHQLGAPVPSSRFGTLAWGHFGVGRLALEALVDPVGKVVAVPESGRFFDTVLVERCAATPLAGSLRCLPATPLGAAIAYVDTQCTEPLLGVVRSGPSCGTTPPSQTTTEGSGCESAPTLWRVDQQLAPAGVFDSSAGGCQPSNVDPNRDYYALSAGDPAALALVVARTE